MKDRKRFPAGARRMGWDRVTPRDLRRTWKTLAGLAGVSKADRDALQNHGARDVSARHYDRYDGMREKRAAVDAWGRWAASIPE